MNSFERSSPIPNLQSPDAGPSAESASEQLARAAGFTGAATLTSRVLGLVRDQVLAALFGAGNEMDAFIVAFRIPNLARDLFAEGAMSAAFVPTFTRHLTLRGKDDAWRLGSNMINALAVITLALVAAGWIFARPLVQLFAGGFQNVPGKLDLTVTLARVVLPFLTLAALAAALMGMLNSLHHYFLPALAPAMFNIATIAGAFILVPLMPVVGWPRIAAIAIAAIIGGVGQVVVQWIPLRHEGFRYRPVLDMRDEGLRRVLLLMGPGTVGLAATQVNAFVNTLLATGQGTGAVSWLSYAFRLMYLPIGLFGISVATAVLPAASRHAARENPDSLRATVSHGLRLMLLLNIPATVGLIVLATPIVRVLFEHGRFSPSDTAATAVAVQLYAVGLIGYSSARIASPVFYAIGRSRVPVIVSALSIAVNIAVSLTLVREIGYRGLALATSSAAICNGAVLLWLLHRHLHGLEAQRLAATTVKMLMASTIMAAGAVGIERGATLLIPGDRIVFQAARLAITIVFSVGILVVAAKLLRVEDLDDATSRVRRQAQKLLGR
jgi:putative peptidoglycan lipid II flippase